MLKNHFIFYPVNTSTYFGTKGDYTVLPIDWNYCFGHYTKECTHDIHHQVFYITLWKLSSKVMTEEGHNNVCLFNKSEIEKHLKEIQQIHDFNYEIKQHKDRYTITIDITAHALYIKFILTWIRLLYEFPNNVLYCEAIKLHKLPEFHDMNLLSVYNLVCSTMYDIADSSFESGFIYPARFTEPITYDELKRRIQNFIKEDKYWINFLFTITKNEGKFLLPDAYYSEYSYYMYKVMHGTVPIERVDEEHLPYYNTDNSSNVFYKPKNCKFLRYSEDDIYERDYSYWTSSRSFQKRLKAYLTNLTILKDYLKNKK